MRRPSPGPREGSGVSLLVAPAPDAARAAANRLTFCAACWLVW
eukprot:CAMPEP_0180797032 /NCGR_PEP_ID=MMETSP1038_2-20121128/57137_1 /TAXON_ID=632150 /ORGANISM="Azadinium spinosum, Strain 3D9" /LENGTH=42 /DNA_ID= /DNA_START= /DNA_END= /DNA_ORIENTATION=